MLALAAQKLKLTLGVSLTNAEIGKLCQSLLENIDMDLSE